MTNGYIGAKTGVAFSDGYSKDQADALFEQAVDSVSTLRGSSFPSNLERLYLSGYYGQGTPGGGELYADRADNSTADNGGTVFVDNDGVRWKRSNVLTLTPEMFGAKGDNSTDDTASLDNLALVGGKIETTDGAIYLYDPSSSPLDFSVDETQLIGKGIIKASNTNNNLCVLSGNDCLVENVGFQGDGTFYSTQTLPEADRRVLLDVTGDNCDVDKARFIDPHQLGCRLFECDGPRVVNSQIIGGPSSQVGSEHQGIRVYDATNFSVVDNNFYKNASGGYVEQGILAASFGASIKDSYIRGNHVDAAWDHAIYVIASFDVIVTENNTTSDSTGIVYSSPRGTANRDNGGVVANNICKASSNVDRLTGSTPGIYMRDGNFQNFHDNIVVDFPVSYRMSPVQFDDINGLMNNNNVSNNIGLNWTEFGLIIALAGIDVGQINHLNVKGFQLVCDTANKQSISTGIRAIVPEVNGSNVVRRHHYEGNILLGCDRGIDVDESDDVEVINNRIVNMEDFGIRCRNSNRFKAAGNRLSNVVGSTSADGAAINLANVDDCDIIDNRIYADNGNLVNGIAGNNTTTNSRVKGNRIEGASGNAIHQVARTDGNEVSGNKIGSDSMTGRVTLAAAATTTVSNNNVISGSGAVSLVRLTPINGAAGSLQSQSRHAYVDPSDNVDGTSFTISTTDGTAANGDEEYYYELFS